LELFVGSECEENEVEKCIWGEGYGGGDGKWEAALKEELLWLSIDALFSGDIRALVAGFLGGRRR
jgi:hypothetical protein